MDASASEKVANAAAQRSSESPPVYPDEKARDIGNNGARSSHDIREGSIDEIKRTREIQNSVPVLRGLRHAEEWLDRKLGVELQGIDRIPDEEKRPPSIWNIFFLWWSLTVHVGLVPLGLLGPEFGLSLQQTVAATVAGNILGAACPAFTGTLGPKVIACSFLALPV